MSSCPSLRHTPYLARDSLVGVGAHSGGEREAMRGANDVSRTWSPILREAYGYPKPSVHLFLYLPGICRLFSQGFRCSLDNNMTGPMYDKVRSCFF